MGQSFTKNLWFVFIAAILLIFFAYPVNAEYVDFGGLDSNLPVIYINTDNSEEVESKTDYIDAEMRIHNAAGAKQCGTEYIVGFNKIEIRGRGNSTWTQEKKPYKIKLGVKSDLFGMGENKHWVLLANAFDCTHMRNILSYNLSGELGLNYIKSQPVEVVFNGRYDGLYQLCENIRIDKNRVNIYSLEDIISDAAYALASAENLDRKKVEKDMSEDLSWISTKIYKNYRVDNYYDVDDIDITGGYLLELDEYYDEISKFTTSHDVPMMIKTPEYAVTNDEIFTYISKYIQDAEDAVYSFDGYNSDGKHYSEYLDVDSFIDYWIVNQTFKSVELLFKSCFMYKDAGGKIVFGPVWDMDWSSGNHVNLIDSSASYDEWNHSESQDREYWYRALYHNPYFIVQLQDRWWQVRDKIDNCINQVDDFAEYLRPAALRNIERWGTIDGWDYDREVSEFKKWMTERVEWMDEQLVKRDPNIMKLGIDSYRGVQMTVLDSSGNMLPEDVPTSAVTHADYKLTDSDSADMVTVRISDSINSANISKYAIYINSLKYTEIPYQNNTEFTVPIRNLYASNGGRSVIYAVGYAGNGITVYSEVYKSIKIDSNSADSPPRIIETEKFSFTQITIFITGIGGLILVTVIFIVKHQRSKRK